MESDGASETFLLTYQTPRRYVSEDLKENDSSFFKTLTIGFSKKVCSAYQNARLDIPEDQEQG
jgi:hypothetical protein